MEAAAPSVRYNFTVLSSVPSHCANSATTPKQFASVAKGSSQVQWVDDALVLTFILLNVGWGPIATSPSSEEPLDGGRGA